LILTAEKAEINREDATRAMIREENFSPQRALRKSTRCPRNWLYLKFTVILSEAKDLLSLEAGNLSINTSSKLQAHHFSQDDKL
jgi:hypothetical protein